MDVFKKFIFKALNFCKQNAAEICAICAIFALALVLRIIALDNFGDLILDETYSLYFASQKTVFGVIKALVEQDFHPPLYFIILHFWIKLFSSSTVSLRACSIFLSMPLILIAYFFSKKYFNKISAIYCATALSVNTFLIFYSIFARFYALSVSLSLALAFIFLGFIQKRDRKSSILFIIFHTLLIYTFSMSFVLSFFYFLFGLIYLISEKKELKNFFKTYLFCFILSLPALIFTVYNFIVVQNNICKFSSEFFHFSPLAFYDILENFFSCENYQIVLRSVDSYRNLFSNLSDLKYLFFAVIPIAIALFGLVKSFLAKDKRLYIFVLPSILSVILVFFLAHFKIIYYQTRYLLLFYPAIVCAFCYGLSLIKNRFLNIFLFCFFIYLNLSYSFFSYRSVYQNHTIELSGSLPQALNNFAKVREDDILFSAFQSKVLKMYSKKGTMIDFSLDEALDMKNKKSLEYYFGKDYKKINPETLKDDLIEDYLNDVVQEPFKTNLKKDYLDKMKKGQRLIFISPYEYNTGRLEDKSNINRENYRNIKLFDFLMTKASYEALYVINQNLKFQKNYRDNKRFYCIYIFSKD